MNINHELKFIKKHYGEAMSHFCRDNFSTILETTGLLSKILIDNFSYNHSLYYDLCYYDRLLDFKDYIFTVSEMVEISELKNKNKSPEELMSEAGYNLYKCNNENEIQAFKKYYASGEELCTFRGNRLDICHVFFAVKKDVDSIKREDFKNPKREDLYGTSVISIQFTKDERHMLSIKNRYNHTVQNPDATYSNNLENIIPGLTESFSEYYGLNQINSITNFELIGYVRANDGKFYKYNHEINGRYYCTNNIIIDENYEVNVYPKEKYIVLEYMLIDLVSKKIIVEKNIKEGLAKLIGCIKNIQVIKENENRVIIFTNDNDIITRLLINDNNQIITIINDDIDYINDYLLSDCHNVLSASFLNANTIGNNVLTFSKYLNDINIPNVQVIGDYFLEYNVSLDSINAKNVKKIGKKVLDNNKNVSFVSSYSLKR